MVLMTSRLLALRIDSLNLSHVCRSITSAYAAFFTPTGEGRRLKGPEPDTEDDLVSITQVQQIQQTCTSYFFSFKLVDCLNNP